MNRRPQLQIVAPGATPEEAAAVVAAIEQFMRETAPVLVAAGEPALSRWQQAALHEGVRRAPSLSPRWS
jgi:ABC-type phosphate transport system permease subunit